MNTTFTWRINSLLTKPQISGDFVVTAYFTVVGKDDKNAAIIQSSQSFSYVSNDPYIPFNDLTEAEVLSWIKDSLKPSGVANLQDNVQKQLDTLTNAPAPLQNQSLPWSK